MSGRTTLQATDQTDIGPDPARRFLLVYLLGAAPRGIATGHVQTGVAAFIFPQIVGLTAIRLFP